MHKALVVPLLWLALTAAAAVPIYDGPTGMTWGAYNAGAALPWARAGGDWTDADGVDYGARPFGSVRYVGGQTGVLQVEATGAGPALYLRTLGSSITLKARESGDGPRLRLTLPDGSEQVLDAIADTTLSVSTGRSLGSLPSMGYDRNVVAFAALPAHTRALLELPIEKAWSGAGTLQVFALRVPPDPPAATTGLSDALIYAEDWDRDPKGWWTRTGYRYRPDATWTDHGLGVLMWRDTCNQTEVGPWGVNGSNGLRLRYLKDTLYSGICLPGVNFVGLGLGELEHVYFRYYLRYGADFRDSTSCDGGKNPGMVSRTDIAGNSGDRVNGLNAWTARGGYILNCDKANPIYPGVMFNYYVYHAGMADPYGYGDHFGFGEAGILQLDTWYCIEGEVQVNTPGVANGVLRGWVNGRLALEKTDFLFRRVKPDLGYGDWREIAPGVTTTAPTWTDPTDGRRYYLGPKGILKGSELGIEKFWETLHHGGRYPFGPPATIYYDETVIARARIGCALLR